MDPTRLIHHLAAVCRQARDGGGYDLLDVQFSFERERRPQTVKTVERFESGNVWPNDPQATVAAYSELTGIPEAELWTTAIRDWQASQAEDQTDDQDLPPGRRPSPPPKPRSNPATDHRQAKS